MRKRKKSDGDERKELWCHGNDPDLKVTLTRKRKQLAADDTSRLDSIERSQLGFTSQVIQTLHGVRVREPSEW